MSRTTDGIKGIGPMPQSFTIEDAAKGNKSYRAAAWSGRYLQVTLMSVPVGGDIGLEAHPETDQFLQIDAGSGKVRATAAEADNDDGLAAWSMQKKIRLTNMGEAMTDCLH